MHQTTAAAASAAADAGEILPPYSGPDSCCAKCSNLGAYTQHRRPVAPGVLIRSEDAPLRRGPLPERLERRCERCDFTWDEALCPPGCGMTVEALAYAIDNATPYPLELSAKVCTFMAQYLLKCLMITARPEHPLWQYDAGRPAPSPAPQPEPCPAICEEPHPTAEEEDACERRRAPQPETPPADSEATE